MTQSPPITDHASRTANHSSDMLYRLMKFAAVGAAGVAVQALTLALLLRVAGLHYLVATALAVEATALHNFVWHRKWTWRDRPRSHWALVLLRFNLTNGLASIIGNVTLMVVFVGVMGLNPYASNLLALTICSLINFCLSDRVVFV